MNRRLLTLAAIGILAWLLRPIREFGPDVTAAESTFMLGFALLSAALIGEIVEHIRLPRITGYILAGILFGPHVTGFLEPRILESLDIFNDLAFAFIGLAAGAELELGTLRRRWSSVVLLIAGTTVIVVIGVGSLFFVAASWAGLPGGATPLQVLAVAAMVGVIAAARSPSSAIAIIHETGADGPFSETILGVTMAVDIVVLTLFSVAIALTGLAFAPGQGLDASFVFSLTGNVAISILLGGALGAMMALYLKHEGPQVPLVIAGLCFLVYRLTELSAGQLVPEVGIDVHLEPLLICATAGFVIRNLSRHGDRLLDAMDGVALPVYVLFFTITGARLDLGAVLSGWQIAVAIAVCRAATMAAGSRLATSLAGDPPAYRRNAWLGFVTQAGLSLALIAQIDTGFGDWGSELATILVAVVAINQLVGPAAFKIALERVGEVRMGRRVWRTAS
jgi:Kef-type K+ transport system membrane component KefB